MFEWEKFLNDVYFNLQWPGAFAGPSKLQKILLENGFNVKLHKIKQWTQNQDSYSLLKPVRYRFKQNRIITTGIDGTWDADLADVSNIKEHNEGYSYLLVAIDIFSRYLWIVPVKTKSQADVKAAFEVIFNSTDRRPKRLRTDNGKEFKNQLVKHYLKGLGIKAYTTKNETKANYAERVIRTIKGLMYRYFIHKQTYKYVNVLQDLVNNYNRRPHRSLFDKSPSSVRIENESSLWKKMYVDTAKKGTKKTFAFKAGDKVRISHLKYTFQRDYQQKWTEEHFVIVHRLRKGFHNMYRLKDTLNEDIEGLFYEIELQKIEKDDHPVVRVEKVLKRRKRRGEEELLIKWSGWPKKFNSWIRAKDAQNY